MGFFKKLFGGSAEPAKAPPAPPPAAARPAVPVFDAARIDWNEAAQADFFSRIIAPQIDESLCKFLARPPFAGNSQITASDAAILSAIVCGTESSRMMEVGGGFSTMAIHHAKVTKMLPGELITIDDAPPTDLVELVDAHLATPLQKVLLEDFLTLQRDEMLIIDLKRLSASTSDVDYLLRDILPKLNPGVLVGAYGIALHTMTASDARNLLLAFAGDAARSEILLSTAIVQRDHDAILPDAGGVTSLWFRIR
ncbi:MAG TPA: hypothetical protein PKH51_02535 [Candidatus Sumerlaeota bacterium]|nr:hypothetical protein [Candidatus Sumerlaeota bacterium]